MKIEITCEAGTIRLSDGSATIGSARFADVLHELVTALKHAAGEEEPDQVVLCKQGEFGFQSTSVAEDVDVDGDEG